jgi:hypothetical protein
LHTWHHCLGHLSEDAVLRMLKHRLVRGMDLSGTSSFLTPCEPYLKGKQTQSDIPKQSTTCVESVLGCIHSDVCGPLPTLSHSGYKYFATFIDDESQKVSVVAMRKKSELVRHLKARTPVTSVLSSSMTSLMFLGLTLSLRYLRLHRLMPKLPPPLPLFPLKHRPPD